MRSGLFVATVGQLSSFLLGVLWINVAGRKGLSSESRVGRNASPSTETEDYFAVCTEEQKAVRLHAGNITGEDE